MKIGLMRLWTEEQGQDLVEYVRLVTVVALACDRDKHTVDRNQHGLW